MIFSLSTGNCNEIIGKLRKMNRTRKQRWQDFMIKKTCHKQRSCMSSSPFSLKEGKNIGPYPLKIIFSYRLRNVVGEGTITVRVSPKTGNNAGRL